VELASARTAPSRARDAARSDARVRAPRVRASSAIVLDAADGTLLYQKNEREPRPIASITKLMTAIVFVETGASVRERVSVEPEDLEQASRTIFRSGETAATVDFLFAMLLNSDNVAARTVARASGLEPDEFVTRMNRKARALGLEDTRFVEPSGLDPGNVSTALDCAALVESAIRDPYLRTILMTQEHTFQSSRRQHTLHSTNVLLQATDKIVVGKTGYIQEAGYCFASSFNTQGRDLAVVVLGARTSSARFREAHDLIRWALAAEAH
jgi:D-alanyl-D-alanine endopeptidase (penicillin-binding protein 7)